MKSSNFNKGEKWNRKQDNVCYLNEERIEVAEDGSRHTDVLHISTGRHLKQERNDLMNR